MNLNLDLLKTFNAVAKNKNITKASCELIISQPAVSKSIKNLENQLNTKLFIRSKKGVELTEDGKILFNATSQVLSILENALNDISDFNQINILISRTLAENILYPYLLSLKNKYSSVKFNISSSSINGVLESLKNKKANLSIGYYIDDISSMFIQKKIKDKLHPIFVCNSSYKELIDNVVDIKKLEKYPFIISAKGSTTYQYALDIFTKYDLKITPSMEVLGTTLVTQSVMQGMGISILTREFISRELDNGDLYEIKINQELDSRALSLIYYKNTKLSREITYLIDLLTK